MTWDEVREVAAEPLVTIGAHSMSHATLAQLTPVDLRAEIAVSVERVEAELGRDCRHFCYPYGDAASAGEREFAVAAALGLATGSDDAEGADLRRLLPGGRLGCRGFRSTATIRRFAI